MVKKQALIYKECKNAVSKRKEGAYSCRFFREHSPGSECGEAPETGSSHSIQRGWREEEI